MNRSFRAPERLQTGNLRMRDNRDEDLALFRELRKREKERDGLLLLQDSDDFDAPLGSKTGSSPIFNITSGRVAPALIQKGGAHDLLNSDNDKNDYEWLITPPGTPLFPSLEIESQKTVMNLLGAPRAHPTSLNSRLPNPMPESGRSILSSKQLTSSSGLNTSTDGLHRPSSSGGGGPGSRTSTPTGCPTLSSISSRSTSTPASNRRILAATKSSSTTSKVTSTATSKPSRSATPTARPTLPSAKPLVPPRSSTPTARSTVRSSTPTSSKPSTTAPKSLPRTATPTRRPSVPSSTDVFSLKSPTSSVDKAVTTAVKHPVLSRSSSPRVKPRPWKPSEMPGFSLDAPPNLRTSLPDRPLSATRGRPGAPGSRSTSIETNLSRTIRRQSCSPSRKRPPNGLVYSSGNSVPVPAVTRYHAKANDNVSPVLIGSKMVERVINMRKLVPPKKDDKLSPLRNLSGKSSSPDSEGFGRNLSKKSLDMAIRHMDIRRTVTGNPLPLLMAQTPASNRTRAFSISDSPVATSSNAGSEISVNNNSLCMDGSGTYDEVSSGNSVLSPSNFHGR